MREFLKEDASMRKFLVKEKLGSGAFAEVYLAEDSSLNRQVAIKLIRDEFAEKDSLAISHARTLAALQRHENLVQIYSVGPAQLEGSLEGVKTVVEMEWINGDSLAKKLKGPKFTVSEGRKICEGLQKGMHHMHSNGIVHGDFHPGNVLVDGDCNAIVIDAANRHKVTAFRTTYSNSADLIHDDVASLKFCIRLVIQHMKLVPNDAFSLLDRIDSVETVSEIGSICEQSELWNEQTRQFVFGSVSKSVAKQAIQLLENSQPATLREFAIGCSTELADSITDDAAAPMNHKVDDKSMTSRIELFEQQSSALSSIAGVLAAWSSSDATDRIQLDLLRLLHSRASSLYMAGMFQQIWQSMRLYPVAIVFYSSCFAAYRNGRYGLLRRMLEMPSATTSNLLDEINISVVELEVAWNEILRSQRYTPVSDRIVAQLPSLIPAFSLSLESAANDFDELQMFLSLVLIDMAYPETIPSDEANSATRHCGLKGRFLWRFKERNSRSPYVEDNFLAAISRDGKAWGPLQAGFFRGAPDRAIEVVKYAKLVHNRFRQGYHIF